MAKEIRLRHRRRMKQKESAAVVDALTDLYGMTGVNPEAAWEAAEADPDRTPVYLVGNEILALEVEGQVTPTVRGLLRWPAEKRWVTVDMGAVRFVTNGADTMAPGITDADPAIEPGHTVWIRDERHGKPLAIGVAGESGPDLKAGQKGKVVRAVTYLGDAYWNFGQA